MKRALCIGINYNNSPYQLGGCIRDAEMMSVRIQNAGANVRLVREITSPENVLAILKEYEAIQKKNDTLYISYSGHGTEFYELGEIHQAICLWDGHEITLLTDEDLNDAIKRIPGTVIVVFDSCFSGGMEREVSAPTTRERRCIPFSEDMKVFAPKTARDLTKAPVQKRINMFACKADEVSWDTGVNGLFTASLLSAYDHGTKTAGKLMQKAYNACKPDQHPTWGYVNTSGNKRLF